MERPELLSGLEKETKLLIIIIVVIILAIAIFFGIKALKKHKQLKGDRTTTSDSKSTLNALNKNGISPSYNPAQYDTWANEFKQAWDGCGLGESHTMPIFRMMRNDADIHSLIVAYGTQTIDKCGVWPFNPGDFTGDLPSTLAYKYSGLEQGQSPFGLIVINKTLKNNGLTFQF